MIRSILFTTCLSLLCVTSAYANSSALKAVSNLDRGASEQETLAKLGKPAKREFINDMTAYTFCTSGATMRFAVLIFENGKLVGLKQASKMIREGSCEDQLPSAFTIVN